MATRTVEISALWQVEASGPFTPEEQEALAASAPDADVGRWIATSTTESRKEARRAAARWTKILNGEQS